MALYRYMINNGLFWQTATGLKDYQSIPQNKKHYLPALNIDTSYPPTLLMHGVLDTTVPISDSDEINKVLNTAGVDHVYMRLEGKEHGLDNRPGEDVVQIKQKVIEFILEKAK